VDIEQQSLMFSELSDLIQKQITAARKGDYNAIEPIIADAGLLVNKMKTCGAFQNPQFDNKKCVIAGLYRKLELAIAAEKETTEKQKNQILTTRNVLTTYINT
jgi:hypothetical protein